MRVERLPDPRRRVVGVDAGIYDRARRALGVPATPYNGGEAPFDKERFANARAEDYWNVRGIFETGEIDIDELGDVLAAQLGRARGRLILVAHQDRVKGRHA